MGIKKAVEFGENVRDKIGELYINEFYDAGLKHFNYQKEQANLIVNI